MKQFSMNIGGSGGGGSGNSFETIHAPNGTDPVASGGSTLSFTSSNGSVTITGDASTKTVDFAISASLGGGNVIGTTATTVNALSRWSNTNGTGLNNSLVIVDNSGNMSGVNRLAIGTTLNQLSVGAVNLQTFNFAALGASQTITFSDAGGNDSVAYLAATQTFTNKTISASSNTISNIANANIAAAAAISVNKLAALTVSKAVVTDGSGFLTTANPSVTEINFVAGVSLAIQTQLAARASLSFTTIQTDAGTSPVADGVNDTLTLTSAGTVTTTGNAATDTVSIDVNNNTSIQKIEVTKNSGAVVSTRKQLNFIEGTNVTLTIADDSGNDQTDITIASSGGAGGYSTIQEEGSNLTQRATLNFVGAAATAADDAGNTRTNVSFASQLNSLAAFNTNGLITQTAANTYTGRTIVGPAAGLTLTNGDGVSGNPTISLTNDLAAVEALSSNGIVTRTATDTWTTRTITAGAGVTVTNGDGISGNPVISLGANGIKRGFGISIDGGGAPITTGVKGYITVPYAGTINQWTMLASSQTGSISMDVWRTDFSGALPTVSNSIVASAPPSIVSGIKGTTTTLTGWTLAVNAGDVIGFNVASAASLTFANLFLTMNVT